MYCKGTGNLIVVTDVNKSLKKTQENCDKMCHRREFL